MRVYICGPMSLMPNLNAEAFREAARSLRANGHTVVSPIELDESEGTLKEVPVGSPEWQRFLKRDLTAMLTCDSIHALDGWERSRGASLEVSVGRQLGLARVDLGGVKVPWDGSVLLEAESLIHGARQNDYGHPIHDFTRAGRIWGAVLPPCHVCGTPVADVPPERVGLCLNGVKMSRECNAHKRDNCVDGPGYWGTVDLIHQYREAHP